MPGSSSVHNVRHKLCGDMHSMTPLYTVSQFIVVFLQANPKFNVTEALQSLVCFVAQPNVTTTSTSVTRLLTHIVSMLSMYLTRPACSAQEIDSRSRQSPLTQGDKVGPDNSSMLDEECLQRGAVLSTAQQPAHQAEVLSQAVGNVLPPQQLHRQLDTQTCALLIHELLEPLASSGSFEKLVCQHIISRLRSNEF